MTQEEFDKVNEAIEGYLTEVCSNEDVTVFAAWASSDLGSFSGFQKGNNHAMAYSIASSMEAHPIVAETVIFAANLYLYEQSKKKNN